MTPRTLVRRVVATGVEHELVVESRLAAAVVTEVEGSAYRTGRSEFELDSDDTLGEGFLLR